MTKISSSSTFYYKRVFPVIWFGFLAFSFVASAIAMNANQQKEFVFLLVPVVMMVFGYLLMKALVFDLVDEVWDDGDALIVRNKGIEECIPLTNIINVSHSSFTNPARVSLMLREPGAFGKEITFSPPMRLNPFTRDPMVSDLIERIDEERRKE